MLACHTHSASYHFQVASPHSVLRAAGVLVIDRVNGIAYVDISERADESIAREWVEKLGYKELVAFRYKTREHCSKRGRLVKG